MNGLGRWIAALLAAAAIVGLLLFARGTPNHGEPVATGPVAMVQAAD